MSNPEILKTKIVTLLPIPADPLFWLLVGIACLFGAAFLVACFERWLEHRALTREGRGREHLLGRRVF